MEADDWKNLISINPEICHGKACIRGTRIMVSVVVDNVAEGHSIDEIINAYPSLTPEAVRAAILYASAVTRERILPIKVEGETAEI